MLLKKKNLDYIFYIVGVNEIYNHG